MYDLFKENGFDLDKSLLEKFQKYYELLVFYNEKFNITAITEKEEVYKKHFIDSLFGTKYIKEGCLIDVGSGGGFPAIPLKIVNNSLKITLLEATGKKCEFLTQVIKELQLKDINVINGRAEELAKNINFREKFDYCTARAVARLNTLSEYCIPFVKKGGFFIAYKGDAEEEIKESTSAVKLLGGRIKFQKDFEFYGAKRTIIGIEKISLTDKKYPRGHGKERKNPL